MAPAAILAGPFVLWEDADTLRIRFEAERPEHEITLLHGSDSRTRVRPAYVRGVRDTFLGEVAVELAGAHRAFRGYEITNEGRPAARYEWKSRIDGTWRGPPRLIVFGDSQGGAVTLARLAAQWRAEKFDAIVGLGDLADAGSRYESWHDEFFAPLRELLPHVPFVAICGNHDSYREKSLRWFDWYFGRADGRRCFRIDFGDLRFVVLNNSDVHTKYGFDPIEPLTAQYDFLLESVLGESSMERRIAVFAHVPIFSGSTVVNAEFGSELQRRYVRPVLERGRVLGFFAGHHHKYERVARSGLHGPLQYIVTGGGGGRLFTAGRERGGGVPMDREVFEVHHSLMVDFSPPGTVVAHALGGAEIDRTMFPAGNVEPPPPVEWEFRDATVTPRLEHVIRDRRGPVLHLAASPENSAPPAEHAARLLQTDRGLVLLAENLSAFRDGASLQGYDWPRQAWSFLQGGSLSLPRDDPYSMLSVVTLDGAEVAPLDRFLPVLHWPLARVRAGIDPRTGALMLLRGQIDFELAPDPGRLIAKWRWGKPPALDLAPAQRARQWAVMDAPPTAPGPEPATLARVIERIVAEQHPEGFVVQDRNGRVHARLVHWPRLACLAVTSGDGTDPLFISTARGAQLERATVAGRPGLRVNLPGRERLFLPLAALPPVDR